MSGYLSPRQQFSRYQASPSLCYFDSAASCWAPQPVLDAYLQFYQQQHASVHRSAHAASRAATAALEQARAVVAAAVAAPATQLSLQASSTAALNLLAAQLPIAWQPGDVILLSRAEHHANAMPWQRLAAQQQLTLRWLDIDAERGCLQDDWRAQFCPRTKVLAITHASNVTGAVLPVAELCAAATAVGAWSIVDSAQAAAHTDLDVNQIGCDALVFSAHKCYGVTGSAALYLSQRLLAAISPWQLGGGIFEQVVDGQAHFVTSIHKLEAGTPNSAAHVAFAAALQWLQQQQQLGLHDYLQGLRQQLLRGLQQRPWLRVLPSGPVATPLVSFYSPTLHAFDLASWLDDVGIAVRAGQHCASNLLQYWGLESVVRVSLGAYNTAAEIEHLLDILDQAHCALE